MKIIKGLSQDPNELSLNTMRSMGVIVAFLRPYEDRGLGKKFSELETAYHHVLSHFQKAIREQVRSELTPVFYDARGDDRRWLKSPQVEFVLTVGRTAFESYIDTRGSLERAEIWQVKQHKKVDRCSADKKGAILLTSRKKSKYKRGSKKYKNDRPDMNNGRGGREKSRSKSYRYP